MFVVDSNFFNNKKFPELDLNCDTSQPCWNNPLNNIFNKSELHKSKSDNHDSVSTLKIILIYRNIYKLMHAISWFPFSPTKKKKKKTTIANLLYTHRR